MLYKRMGVWHNPRIQKQKQYIPKYALTLSIVSYDYKLPDFLFSLIGSSVIIYLCSRARNNQPLLIACKSIKIFQHIQISMKKIFVFFHLRQKTNLCTTHFSVCTALRVLRYNFFWYSKISFYFLFLCDRLKTAVIACNIWYRWLSILNELVYVERLAFEEEGGDKGVADLQFGVNWFFHHETHISQITEDATAVRKPCDLYPLIRL